MFNGCALALTLMIWVDGVMGSYRWNGLGKWNEALVFGWDSSTNNDSGETLEEEHILMDLHRKGEVEDMQWWILTNDKMDGWSFVR